MNIRLQIIQYIKEALGTNVTVTKSPQEKMSPSHGSAFPNRDTRNVANEANAFKAHLKQALERGGSHSHGELQIISLENVRHHFSSDWTSMREKILNVAAQIIESNLGKGDIYTSFYDVYFVIFYKDLTLRSAQAKCALIARQISNRIFGNSERASLINISTATLDRSGNISVERVDFEKRLDDIISTHSEDYFQDVHVISGNKEEDAHPEKDAALHGANRDISLSAEKYAEKMRLQLPPHEEQHFSFGKLNFAFRPIWLVKDHITSAMLCVPTRVTSEGTLRIGGAALLSSPGSSVNPEYDHDTIKKVLHELHRLEERGQSAILIAPVHFVTIANSHYSQAYLQVIRTIPEHLRSKILFELIATPSGTPQTRIVDVISALRLFVDNLLIRVRLEDVNLSRLMGLGVFAIGADITNIEMPEAEIIPLIDAFVARAKPLGFRVYLHGVHSRSLISAAVCSGVDFVDGDPVTSVVDAPQKNEHFDLDELYKPVVTKDQG